MISEIRQSLGQHKFPSMYEHFIYLRTYARWDNNTERRETWIETVMRYTEYIVELTNGRLGIEAYRAIALSIYKHETVPSMRLLWSAGDCVRKNGVTAYNCAYQTISDVRSFSESLSILMSGAGDGYSVEKRFVNQLPTISRKTGQKLYMTVKDSRQGWVEAFEFTLRSLFVGSDVQLDYSKIRPSGSILKTMGGRASGPEPYKNLIDFVCELFRNRQGQKLSTYDCHEIMCKIAEIVVVGGVRRSSLICICDKDDHRIMTCKQGNFFVEKPHLAMANISAAYNESLGRDEFDFMWDTLRHSGTGEPGIFNRKGLYENLPERRASRFSLDRKSFGLNPCGEILLDDMQFCNLSEVITRPSDTVKSLGRKIIVAATIGTIQSMISNFSGLRKEWTYNTENERLLGVSITGQFDNSSVFTDESLMELRNLAVETNARVSRVLGINSSSSVTCVKPSGNTSNLSNCSPGLHPRWSKYAIRRVQISNNDPLLKYMQDQGAKVEESVYTPNVSVLSFPIASLSKKVKTRHDIDAIEHLNWWRMFKDNYCEHNPSASIYVAEGEWDEVGQFVWKNFDSLGGLTFFPKSDAVYEQSPYEEITKSQYYRMRRTMPEINFSELERYEKSDNTVGAKSMSCQGNECFFLA